MLVVMVAEPTAMRYGLATEIRQSHEQAPLASPEPARQGSIAMGAARADVGGDANGGGGLVNGVT
jgi:hypothetical protein